MYLIGWSEYQWRVPRKKKTSFSRFFPWRFSSPNFLKIAALLWSFGPNLQETPDSQPLPLAASSIVDTMNFRDFPPKTAKSWPGSWLNKNYLPINPQNLVRQHTPANKAFPAGPLVKHWLGTRSSWRKKAREHGKPPLSRTFSQHLKTMNMCVLLYRAQKKQITLKHVKIHDINLPLSISIFQAGAGEPFLFSILVGPFRAEGAVVWRISFPGPILCRFTGLAHRGNAW